MYLAGKLFILQTDHQRLTFLNDAKLKNDPIMRWALAIQGYDYTVKTFREKMMCWLTALPHREPFG